VSLGLLAVALAVVVPWLVYRDLGSLTISRAKFAGLTHTAQLVLKQRQETVETLQSFLPWASVVILVIGVVLVCWGGKRMRDAQHWEDRGLRARTQQEEASIRPQTESERRQRIAEEVVAETASASGSGTPSNRLTSTQLGSDRRSMSPSVTTLGRSSKGAPPAIREAAAIQDEVLDRIEAILPAGFSLRREVIVSQGMSRLSLDGLLRGSQGGAPDVLVEVRVYRLLSSVLARAAEQVIASAVRYRDMTGRPAVGWLILVYSDKEPSDAFKRRIRDTLGTYGRLTVIRRDDIQHLGMPD
jgi:hypothetical protein